MILIVACHITQYFQLQVAFILNVGVQIFFFMSGFLYGKSDSLGSPWGFYKKRFFKVFVPYYVWLALVIVVYAVFHLYQFDTKQVILYLFNLQWFAKPIEGLNHLWFLTVLMFGYLLTPWVKKLLKRFPFVFVLAFVGCCVIEFVYVKKFYSIFAWIALYLSGLLYGSFETKKISNIVLVLSLVVLVVLGMMFNPNKLVSIEFRYYNIWLHWVLGVFLFVSLFRFLPEIINHARDYKLLRYIDKLSYEIYLVHHPLILGPLSMMILTPYVGLNIVLLLVLVYLLAICLRYICSFTKHFT